jgi:hypothetical protein
MVDSLKVLDPERPIREEKRTSRKVGSVPSVDTFDKKVGYFWLDERCSLC